MKKLIVLLLIPMLFMFVGCSSNNTSSSTEKIMSKSIDALRKELPGQTLNKDFVMKYIDEASKINEEDIQDIWVKLLVQENKSYLVYRN